jgi:Domain of unknown function (DUF4390)
MFRKNSLSSKSTRRGIGALLLAFAGLSFPASAATPLFTVHDAKTELVGDVYRLDANLELRLTPQALKALENGVALTIILDIEVYSPSRYLWDTVLASLEQRYEIQYHALADQYLLRSLNSGSQFVYSTLGEALATLGRIEKLPVLDAHLLQKDELYKVRVRSRLDLSSLPVPMQLKAYVSSEWWLSSGWYSWDL